MVRLESMWWIGYLEAVRPPRYPWFFHVDYYEILKLHFKNQFLEEESETQEALLSRSAWSVRRGGEHRRPRHYFYR